MRIKKLELIGFKSFKDRTVIQFDAGITGIVGPNGCGKSNIIDALMWVMGEQSAKHLRGGSMEDVIFGGAEGYVPAGMAEVSLTLENDEGPFPTKYANFSEVQVTRRLHRSGESEYLINKEPARLRDIQEIFMDTGAGSKGFSIIEQGAIGKIITAKPEDRRTLIEEAAGITKFKARKRESQKKLEATDQNLIRLNDIVGELRRQIEGLQRQAKRAERYRELKKRIEALDLWISSEKFAEIEEAIQQATQIFEDAQNKEIAGKTDSSSLESQSQELQLAVLEKDKKVQDLQSQYQFVKQSVQTLESEAQLLKFEIEQAKREEQLQGTLKTEVEARKVVVERELQQIFSQNESLQSRLAETSKNYSESSEAYQEMVSFIQEADESLTLKRRELVTVSQGVTQLTVQLESLAVRIEELEERAQNEKKVLEELQGQQNDFEQRKSRLNNQIEKERQMQLSIMGDVENFELNKVTLQAQIDEKQTQVEQFKDQLNVVTSRLYGLENLHANFEGFEDGVKSVMMWSKQQKSIHSDGSYSFQPVSEVVEVPKDYEMAMEAALGTRLQLLLNPMPERTLGAVDYLKREQTGRSSFYMGSNSSQEIGSLDGTAPSGEGVVTRLMDVVQVPEDHRSTAQKLLGKVVVVDSLSSAIRLQREFSDWTFVTQDGDTLGADGVLTAGASSKAESGILKRRREMKELSIQKDEWAGKLSLAQLALEKLQDQIKTVHRDLENSYKQKIEKEVQLAELKKDHERAVVEMNNLMNAIAKQDKEYSQTADHLRQNQVKSDEMSSRLKELEEQKANLERVSEDLNVELMQRKNGVEELREKVTQLQVLKATQTQEAESLSRNLNFYTQQLKEMEDQLGRMKDDAHKNSENFSTFSTKLQECQVELSKKIESAEQLEKNLSEEKDSFEKMSGELRSQESKLFEVRRQMSDLQSAMNSAQLRRDEAQMKKTYMVEQIQERYMVDIREVAHQYRNLETDIEAGRVELEDLKDKVKKIGEVNLSAIEEYEQISQRYEFLSKQQQDLLDAKENLRKVIDRINRICVKRFKETFEAVNDRFTKVFPVLFGGGEAKLMLVEDPEDGEDGIDILARPPGKKLQNMTLLSGGEKALTAVSLIFSIFLVRPSPFCLLDEVDAPLDDANVVRFNDLVREMAKRSQIIIITHNKTTMEVNEKLYGVTMQERGVSRMVSVDLQQARAVV